MSGSSAHFSPFALPASHSSNPNKSRTGQLSQINADGFDWLGDPDLHADFGRAPNARCPEMYDGMDQDWDLVNKEYFAIWGKPDYEGEGWGQCDDDGEWEDGYPRGRMAWWEIEQQTQEEDDVGSDRLKSKKRSWGFHGYSRDGWPEVDEDDTESEGVVESGGWVVDCGEKLSVWEDTWLHEEGVLATWGKDNEQKKTEIVQDIGLALDRCNEKVHCMMKFAARKLSQADMWPEAINFWWITKTDARATFDTEENCMMFLNDCNSRIQGMIRECTYAIRT